nr:zinc finger protein 782-like [Leptinotarsa decemlineata]
MKKKQKMVGGQSKPQTRRYKRKSRNSDSDPDFLLEKKKVAKKIKSEEENSDERKKSIPDTEKPAKKRKSRNCDMSDKDENSKQIIRRRKNIKLELVKIEKFVNLNEVKEPLKCGICTESFMSHVDLGLHSKVHNEDGLYSCHQCDYTKEKKSLFKNHVLSHDLWKCEKCNKIFRSKRCALKHSKTHVAKSFVQCEMCGKDVRNVYLDTHKKLVHADEKTIHIYKCTLCDKSYKNSTALKGHYSYNHKDYGIDTSVICDICGMRLSCKGKLAQHTRTHTGDRPYSCTVCPRKFISNDILRAHMRVHTGEKPYVCMYCGKKFAHGAPYRYHIKTHTGEKSFNCSNCGKGFISRANMKIHMKSCLFPVRLLN